MTCNTTQLCCPFNLGIGCAPAGGCGAGSGCDTGGCCDLRIAKACAVLSVVEDAAPDVVVSDIVMNTLLNNPTTGDDEHQFYLVCTEDQTLNHTFEWTCDDDTNQKSYTETVAGDIEHKTARNMYILQQWMCDDVIILAKEACDGGQWFMVGLGGGFKLNSITGGTGTVGTDSNATTISISGEALTRGWVYVDAGDAATTDTLVDSITSVLV